jgi:glycine C-acetyltransferase
MGTESSYTFVSCWTATEALFPTLCEAGRPHHLRRTQPRLHHRRHPPHAGHQEGRSQDVYKNNRLTGPDSLQARLEEARANKDVTGQIWVVTDGVFSMEGSIADLPAMRRLCDEHNAMLIVDDSHGHGVMGRTGRGTHEHWGMETERGTGANRIDIFTGTLGKALGGAAGGFVAGPKRVTDLIVQRGRPTLFSNALPVTVAAIAAKAIEILMREPQRAQKLKDNVAYARKKIKAAGFQVLESPTAICPIIVHDTAKAIAMSKKLLELGVFVIGFGFPVVPEGHARLRVQISAAHEKSHIDTLVSCLKKL